MKICIPVDEDKGMDSPVCGHFGSAPMFMIVDVDSGSTEVQENANKIHQHGMCQPLAALGGHDVNAVVVGGIGMGALMKLKAAGVEVYLSEFPTVKETIDAHKAGSLRVVTPQAACGGHQHGHGQCGGH